MQNVGNALHWWIQPTLKGTGRGLNMVRACLLASRQRDCLNIYPKKCHLAASMKRQLH